MIERPVVVQGHDGCHVSRVAVVAEVEFLEKGRIPILMREKRVFYFQRHQNLRDCISTDIAPTWSILEEGVNGGVY